LWGKRSGQKNRNIGLFQDPQEKPDIGRIRSKRKGWKGIRVLARDLRISIMIRGAGEYPQNAPKGTKNLTVIVIPIGTMRLPEKVMKVKLVLPQFPLKI
jgi:hypothetical protein